MLDLKESIRKRLNINSNLKQKTLQLQELIEKHTLLIDLGIENKKN